ncbi:leucyl/phenylalanyl-tRNA--protein transferase [Elioraea rosea]|uniref:leucyl/phenylalanyl-tRNA--protein transferase n=1 Tax=Elioraea rosea TaxID=2492390 RepID=UPI001187010D|nr:leucyl/phenylalanyl-tRNA--protein transferase [Elioraea rosea]
MARREPGETTVTPELVLRAYRAGLFPMAERRNAERLYWLDPDRRGVQPLDAFHLPRRLARTVLSGAFEVRCDGAFSEVLAGCAESTEDRPETWINTDIERLFGALHAMGYAHSVECWRDGRLVGGLYGVALGGAFFGESMFSRERDASKVALVHLVVRLRLGGFVLLDTQFVTDHLARFGAIEVPRLEYRRLLAEAVELPAVFRRDITPEQLRAELARMKAER